MTTKKYTNRPSPPYPAKHCPRETKKGNDGCMYNSVPDVNGVYIWRKVGKSKSKSVKKSGIKLVPPSKAVKMASKDELLTKLETEPGYKIFHSDYKVIVFDSVVYLVQFTEDGYSVYLNPEESGDIFELFEEYPEYTIYKSDYISRFKTLFRTGSGMYLYVDPDMQRTFEKAIVFKTDKKIKMLHIETNKRTLSSFIQLEGEADILEFPRLNKSEFLKEKITVDVNGKIHNVPDLDEYWIDSYKIGKCLDLKNLKTVKSKAKKQTFPRNIPIEDLLTISSRQELLKEMYQMTTGYKDASESLVLLTGEENWFVIKIDVPKALFAKVGLHNGLDSFEDILKKQKDNLVVCKGKLDDNIDGKYLVIDRHTYVILNRSVINEPKPLMTAFKSLRKPMIYVECPNGKKRSYLQIKGEKFVRDPYTMEKTNFARIDMEWNGGDGVFQPRDFSNYKYLHTYGRFY